MPKLPGIPGIERFKGHSFHTSRWDYDYTGGDPRATMARPLDQLADKRVGDHRHRRDRRAVRAAPRPGRARSSTSSSAPRRRSTSAATCRIDPEWFAAIATPGWQQRWLENFTANQAGGCADEDLVQDGWTDLSRRIRAKLMELPDEQRTPQNMLAAFEDSDFEKMEEIRARVDAIVDGPGDGRER